MKNNFILFVFFLISSFSVAQTSAKVIGIKDGDTILILLENKTQKTLRLAEVDCPESGQPFGKNAKDFTSSQVFGKIISFVETDQDRYGRTIAKVYYDNGKYLSKEIIKNGLGWFYFKYSNNKELEKLHYDAKEKKLGLWQDIKAISPYEWRQLQK
jgi:endonuclease YncB( thermonuclease family)